MVDLSVVFSLSEAGYFAIIALPSACSGPRAHGTETPVERFGICSEGDDPGAIHQHRQVFPLPLQPFQFLYRFFNARLFLADAACVRGVVPEIRRGDPEFNLPQAVLKTREVKDAPEVRSFGS